MVKTYETKLQEKKDEIITFKEGTSFAKIQEQIAELFIRIKELEDVK